MSTDYSTYSADELLEALEYAGRHPDPDLIEECLDRREELTPGLLEMLGTGIEEEAWDLWGGDDPRWYREIHAGQLLLAFEEAEAVPLFEDILRDPDEDRQNLLEWFDMKLPALGPPFIPALIAVMRDSSVSDYGRSLSIGTLSTIAYQHPETHERVLEALRARLPMISPEGELAVEREVPYKQIEHWTWVASALANLQDEKSRPRIEGLYEADLIDTFILGDRDDYHALMAADASTPRGADYEIDLVAEYRRRNEREREDESPAVARDDRSQPQPTDINYSAATAGELLDALAWVGRMPEPALIRACVERQREMTPGLLDILREDIGNDDRERWADDDPRWYRMIHAGLLLIHFREEDALPFLVEDYRQSGIDDFDGWFGRKMRRYGPPAIPALTDLLADEDAGVWGRIEAAGELAHIAWAHPDERERVLTALRSQLPPLDDDDAPDVSADEVDEDRSLLWTNVAYELARLRDEESRPQVDALFEHELLDPMVFGDQDDYHRILKGEGGAWVEFEPASFDVVQDYEDRYRREKRNEERQAERERIEQASEGGHFEGGTFVRDEKVGRNDPCPCGSGRKYKHCCG